MEFKKISRKAAAAMLLSASLVGGELAIAPPATAEAFSLSNINDIGSIVVTGVKYAQLRSQIKQQTDYLDNDPNGRQVMYNDWRNKTGVDYNENLNWRLENMMQNMTAAVRAVDASIDKHPYYYYLNPDDSFNAFCGLGHVMSVNHGAFDYISCDDELAVIVGHEMGHGQKSHAAKGMVKTLDKQLLASVASSVAGGTDLTDMVAGMALKNGVVHATKSNEWEADNLSWEYMTHSNYNPGACAAIWQRVIDKLGNNSQSGAALWFNPSDHPNHAARRDNYAKKLTAYSGKHVTDKDGVVYVNGKKFVTPAPAGGMSTKERSYFVMGNLAAAYHNGHNKAGVTANGNTVMMGAQPILTCTADDEAAQTLADRLNSIK